jgi:hypothetical protein
VAIVRHESTLGKSKPAKVANSQEGILLWMCKTAGQLGECPKCPKCDCEIKKLRANWRLGPLKAR